MQQWGLEALANSGVISVDQAAIRVSENQLLGRAKNRCKSNVLAALSEPVAVTESAARSSLSEETVCRNATIRRPKLAPRA